MSSILYIEDDLALIEAVQSKLKDQYVIHTAPAAQMGIQKAIENDYDLIILDYYLPDGNGLTICRELRQNEVTSSILFLTQNDSKKDIVAALDAGADDYLTKPFQFEELQARIRALLRRSTPFHGSSLLTIGGLCLDQQASQVCWQDHLIPFKRREYMLLEFLMIHRNQTISKQRLYEHIWGGDYDPSNTIEVHIRRLRKKLKETNPKLTNCIHTIYGIGYKLDCAVLALASTYREAIVRA